MHSDEFSCQVCQKKFSKDQLVHIHFLRPNLIETGLKYFKNFQKEGFICFSDLRKLRDKRIEDKIRSIADLSAETKDKIISSIQESSFVSEDIHQEYLEKISFGEKASDAVAKFGGSWFFIGIFTLMIAAWVIWNNHEKIAFDPFPYIFLNLFLSCIAAFQAPIIMMSQNRQAYKDRLRDTADYQVNLKAELEIQQLHNKLDLFMKEEWHKLMEIQKLQLEIAEDIVETTSRHHQPEI